MNKILLFTITFSQFSNVFFADDYCKMADKITAQYSKELAKEKGIFLTGSGGAMMSNIQQFSLYFTVIDHFSVAEARRLYLQINNEFLNRINQNKQIRPYLDVYPFTFVNIDISLHFQDEKGKRPQNGAVAYMFQGKNNQLCYSGYDCSTDDLYRLHRETYEEAEKIVHQEKNLQAGLQQPKLN